MTTEQWKHLTTEDLDKRVEVTWIDPQATVRVLLSEFILNPWHIEKTIGYVKHASDQLLVISPSMSIELSDDEMDCYSIHTALIIKIERIT